MRSVNAVVTFACVECGAPGSLKAKSLSSGCKARCIDCRNASKMAKTQATCLTKHGVAHHMQRPGMHERVAAKRTMNLLGKYGVAMMTTDPVIQTASLVPLGRPPRESGPCIYGWHDKQTDMWYVGLTFDLTQRTRAHLCDKDGSAFHVALSSRRKDFDLWCLYRPEMTPEMTVDDLQQILIDKEVEHIASKHSFQEGYNRTMGGALSRIEISNHKRMRRAMDAFEGHLQGARWYVNNVGGPLGAVQRDYVLAAPGMDYDGTLLGHLVHKWRENRGAAYLLVPHNIDRLMALGFTWKASDIPGYVSCRGLMAARDEHFSEIWRTKWLPSLLWCFAQHGHVNMPQTYVMPTSDESVPPGCSGAKLGILINAIRKGIHTDHSSMLRRRLLFYDNLELWKDRKILEGMRKFRLEFQETATKTGRVPQWFQFPCDYHVRYLRGYGLGANLVNLMRRRSSPRSAEQARFARVGRLLVLELVLLAGMCGIGAN